MPTVENIAGYLTLADELFSGELAFEALPAACAPLPPLTRPHLDTLVLKIDAAIPAQPRLGWAIAAVAEAAAQRSADPFLHALAAWRVAYAANEWVRPARVEEAALRARAGFETLGEAGWIAACEWQRYALPWTRNDFKQAAVVLAHALDTLEMTGLHEFVPHCRVSLAYAQILMAHYTEANDNLSASESAFVARSDLLNRARCWLYRSSSLRRQGNYEESLALLQNALDHFKMAGSPIEIAKVNFQQAYALWRLESDYSLVVELFSSASSTFREHDLPLWEAQCMSALAQIHNDRGEFRVSKAALHAAQQTYTQYDIWGLQADALLDSGRLEMYLGNRQGCLRQLSQAEQLYQKLNARQMVFIAATYLGQAYSRFGHYLQALQYLERAQDGYKAMHLPERLAECHMHMAHVWLRLGQVHKAFEYIDLAQGYYFETQQKDHLITLYNRQAEAHFIAGNPDGAIHSLSNALEISMQIGLQNLSALSHRLLGETWLSTGKLAKASHHLDEALSSYKQMGMKIDQAACLVALGEYHLQISQRTAAQKCLKKALQLSKGLAPDATWQARAGLAKLATENGAEDTALIEYERMVACLVEMRRRLGQPALAGSYMRSPAPKFDQAVSLAVHMKSVQHALYFIEESKAQTLVTQLANRSNLFYSPSSAELDVLAAEIRWLQEKFRSNSVPSQRLRTAEQADLAKQLRHKLQAYDELYARLERRQIAQHPAPGSYSDFEPARLLQSFNHVLKDGIAIDYYLQGTAMVALVITASESYIWQRPLTSRARMALKACADAQRNGRPPQDSDLAVLGAFLLPDKIHTHLTPQTRLVIVPHRQLHSVPWGALTLPATSQSLVETCIPVVTPSLHSLLNLWVRRQASHPDPSDGLIVAISNFPAGRRSLPQVGVERERLAVQLSQRVKILAESEATRDNLQALAREQGLSRFAFWHIASHAFHDSFSGRLSGIALHDQDLWLDHLWELAPLPNLVTFSTCNGTQTLVYTGDEHIGLATTCLAAGAHNVVGSQWPILDEAAAEIMFDFYTFFRDGKPPSEALALAQRKALRAENQLKQWGGFLCVGAG